MFPVISGSTAFVLPEFSNKVTDIVKSAVQGDICDRLFCMGKKGTGMLDAQCDQILDGRYAGDFPEETAEILAAAANDV